MRKRILIGIALIVVLLGALIWAMLYVYPKPQIASATHQPASDFTLRDAEGNLFTLSLQRGHKTVLYFYRGYW